MCIYYYLVYIYLKCTCFLINIHYVRLTLYNITRLYCIYYNLSNKAFREYKSTNICVLFSTRMPRMTMWCHIKRIKNFCWVSCMDWGSTNTGHCACLLSMPIKHWRVDYICRPPSAQGCVLHLSLNRISFPFWTIYLLVKICSIYLGALSSIVLQKSIDFD